MPNEIMPKDKHESHWQFYARLEAQRNASAPIMPRGEHESSWQFYARLEAARKDK